MIKEFSKQLVQTRSQIVEAGLTRSLEDSIEKRLNHLETNLVDLQEKSSQTLTFMNTIQFDCEQLRLDLKQRLEWLKTNEQEFHRDFDKNFHSADEKTDAARQLLVRDFVQTKQMENLFVFS